LPPASEGQPPDHWRTVRNPVIGDEVTFVRTAGETGGEHTLARVLLKPGGGNPLHYHLTYAEEFEVVDGRLTIHRGTRPADAPGITGHRNSWRTQKPHKSQGPRARAARRARP
jgi:hypothetical protein